MSTILRECVGGLSRGRDVERLLPEYIRQSAHMHGRYAELKLMMEYYVFYEMIHENINPYIATAADIAEGLHEAIEMFFERREGLLPEDTALLEQKLEKLRRDVTERMQVLTAYVDRFVVYEYILNRVQYRFEEQELLPDDVSFAQDVVEFIFSSRDAVTVNDNIRSVLGQLPMRMARSRYFDLIRDSISVYQGSDRSALEGYLYMFRTNAMLYRTPAMEKYFTEFVPVLQELSALDYDGIDGELYRACAEKIRASASKLHDISDLYMLLQQLLNGVYSMVLAAPYDGGRECGAADTVIRGINDLFLQHGSTVWEQAGKPLLSEKEKLCWLEEFFVKIEGEQEKVYEKVTMADAVLEEIAEAQKESIEEMELARAFRVLARLMKLSSGSVFVELDEEIQEEKVTKKQAEEAAEGLLREIKTAFGGQSRVVRRAVMANTLEKIPVFFATPQEVADYVVQSLQCCDDEAEKYASKQLILEMMEK